MKKLLFTLTVTFALIFAGLTPAQAQLFEDFEGGGDKGGYAAGTVQFNTGTWFLEQALVGTADGDRKNGSRSIRIRTNSGTNGVLQMNFNKPNGANEISFYTANSGFSGDGNGRFQVQYSTNNGSSWNDLGDEVVVPNALSQISLPVQVEGDIRFRFVHKSGGRLNIDDIRITDYIQPEEDATIVISASGADLNSGDTIDFSSVLTGTQSDIEVTIRNIGEETLELGDINVVGSSFSAGSLSKTSLEFNETAVFTVTFSPMSDGLKTAELVVNSNAANEPEFELNLSGNGVGGSGAITIAEARQLPQGTVVTVGGRVTVTDQFRGPVYFQDHTAAIAWYDNDLMRNTWALDLTLGDSLLVTGTLGNFNNLLQIIDATEHEIFPEANLPVEPVLITISDLNSGNYESMLIRLEEIEFQASGQFGGGTNYDISDQSGAGQLRVDNFTDIGGSNIPVSLANVTGVAGRFMSTRQILPRFVSDIENATDAPVIVTVPPYEVSATATSITFSWITDKAGHTEIRYGTTRDLELGKIEDQTPKTTHTINLEGLDPGTIYKVELRSAAGTDTTSTGVYVTTTRSPEGTTGDILVYFNKSVDHDFATYREANQNEDFSELLIDKVMSAQQTIDLAFYSISGEVGMSVADAIIAANMGGVRTRVIIDRDRIESSNPVRQVYEHLLSFDIPVIQSVGTHLSHNKFAVVDAGHSSPDRPWVVTSSWNATVPGTYSQFQNMVHIQDVSLAKAYEREFEQMWGSPTAVPNMSNSRFGENKSIVNPSVFWIGEDDTYVRLLFSPQANTETQIQRAIQSAEYSIDLGLNLITRRSISNSMLSRFNEGVKVRGVVGEINVTGSDFEYLSGWADVLHFSTAQFGLLHHKYAVIDGENIQGEPKVITGSHNWSRAANEFNDENTLIIYSPRVANEFMQEFIARYRQAGGEDDFVVTSSENTLSEQPGTFRLNQNYPNPFNPSTIISYQLPNNTNVRLDVYDVMGRRVATLVNGIQPAGEYNINFDASNLASGVYIYRITMGNGQHLSRKMLLVK